MEQGPVPVGKRPPDHIDLSRPDAYGRSFADVYDLWYAGVTDAEATADFVAARCGDNSVLEIGVGSGRLAIPLADRGYTVFGVDASPTMLAQIPKPRAEASGSVLPILADMRSLPVGKPVGAVLIAFNTLFNLVSDLDQQAMLESIASLLAADGNLIIEALDVTSLLGGPEESIGVRSSDTTGVVVTATQLDKSAQIMTGQHMQISAGGISVRPWRLRWLTPAQLDDLCTIAGLELVERFDSWRGHPFTDESETHVSVYRRPTP